MEVCLGIDNDIPRLPVSDTANLRDIVLVRDGFLVFPSTPVLFSAAERTYHVRPALAMRLFPRPHWMVHDLRDMKPRDAKIRIASLDFSVLMGGVEFRDRRGFAAPFVEGEKSIDVVDIHRQRRHIAAPIKEQELQAIDS